MRRDVITFPSREMFIAVVVLYNEMFEMHFGQNMFDCHGGWRFSFILHIIVYD